MMLLLLLELTLSHRIILLIKKDLQGNIIIFTRMRCKKPKHGRLLAFFSSILDRHESRCASISQHLCPVPPSISLPAAPCCPLLFCPRDCLLLPPCLSLQLPTVPCTSVPVTGCSSRLLPPRGHILLIPCCGCPLVPPLCVFLTRLLCFLFLLLVPRYSLHFRPSDRQFLPLPLILWLPTAPSSSVPVTARSPTSFLPAAIHCFQLF